MEDFGNLIWLVVIIISAIVQLFTKKKDGDDGWSEDWSEEWQDEGSKQQSQKQTLINQEYETWRQEQEALEKAQRQQELLAEQAELQRQRDLLSAKQSQSLQVLNHSKEEKRSAIHANEISDKNSSILSQLKLDDKEELRRAIILKNILDKPKALQ